MDQSKGLLALLFSYAGRLLVSHEKGFGFFAGNKPTLSGDLDGEKIDIFLLETVRIENSADSGFDQVCSF